jgi:electron transfer flavoprotein alpha subunit
MIYELRIYRAMPGRMPALLNRFQTRTLAIWNRFGIRQVGFWTTHEDPRAREAGDRLQREGPGEGGRATGVDLANVKMSMNPFDEIAVEEAIRLKEKGVGLRDRRGLDRPGQGAGDAAHRARHGRRPGDPDRRDADVHQDIEPLAVAKLLKAVVDEEKPGLVLCGKQAIDNDMNADGPDAGRAAGLAAGDLRLGGRGRGRSRDGHARGRRRPADREGQAAGDRHRRPAAERAALRQPAQHHEGQEEAARGEDAGGLRRRRHAAAQGREDGGARERARRG